MEVVDLWSASAGLVTCDREGETKACTRPIVSGARPQFVCGSEHLGKPPLVSIFGGSIGCRFGPPFVSSSRLKTTSTLLISRLCRYTRQKHSKNVL